MIQASSILEGSATQYFVTSVSWPGSTVVAHAHNHGVWCGADTWLLLLGKNRGATGVSCWSIRLEL